MFDTVKSTLSITRNRWLEAVAFAFLFGQAIAGGWLVPEWSFRHLKEPVFAAALSDLAVTAFIAVSRLTGPSGSRVERGVLALFLAGMPFVYISSWMVTPEPGRLWIEIVGAAVYVSFACWGMWRSPWALALGIMAHGLLWDLWHHNLTTFIPNWYVSGCLIADIGIGVYAAVQVPAFRRAAAATKTTRIGRNSIAPSVAAG